MLFKLMEFPDGAGRVTTAISCQVLPPSSDRCKAPEELIVQRDEEAGGAAGAFEGTTGGFALSTASTLSEIRGSPSFRLWRTCSGDGEALCAAI
jgi:hypothetical protein